MTIKIVTEFGDEVFFDLPFRVEKVKSVEFVSRAADPPTIPHLSPGTGPKKEVQPNWSGLWLTDSQTFVEVVTNEEAYFLRENGTRLVRCSVNRSGMVSIDGGKACRLMERRRGGESTTQLGKKSWPEPKGC